MIKNSIEISSILFDGKATLWKKIPRNDQIYNIFCSLISAEFHLKVIATVPLTVLSS